MKLNKDAVVRQIIEAQINADFSKDTQFIGGYFAGFRRSDPGRWERYVHELLSSEQTRALGVTVVQWSGTSESVLRMLLDMFRSRKVSASVFGRFAWNATKEGFSVELVEEVLGALVGPKDEEGFLVGIELADFYFFNKKEPRSCNEDLLFTLITAPYFFGRDHDTRARYQWYTVAKGFRTRFPNRDLDLFNVILSKEKENLSLGYSNYPMQIADAIAHDHPDETWEIISKILESDEKRNWLLEKWLGQEFGFDEDQSIGSSARFNPEAVMGWVGKDPKQRARKIMRALPKTLDEDRGGKLTRIFIEAFGDGELGDSLISNFWTGGWSGSESAYLARKRDKARQWVSEVKSGKILAWLYRYIEYLNKMIAQAEMGEEREF